MGIDKYNEACRSIVMRYSKEWEATVKRVGRWIDFENDYKTLDPEFMARQNEGAPMMQWTSSQLLFFLC
jgi:isoleucyl-tRNA synthetase